MKPIEILSSLPQWANAAPGTILDSPAFALPCRLGDETSSLRHARVCPAESAMLVLAVTFGDEPHMLGLARSTRFQELDGLWETRADIPDPILLALAERECGAVFQMLENAVRKQLRLTGLAKTMDAQRLDLELADGSLAFSLTRSESVVSAFGVLRNLDLAHEAIRGQSLPAETEYASFVLPEADIASLAPGDAVLLPEIGALTPRVVADGRFVLDANGVSPHAEDEVVHVRAADGREISLGEVFDAAETPIEVPAAEPGIQLRLVKGGRSIAAGTLDHVARQFAFVVEARM